MGEFMVSTSKSAALRRLLEINAVEMHVLPMSDAVIDAGYDQLFRYHLTPFGAALLEHVLAEHKLSPEAIQRLGADEADTD